MKINGAAAAGRGEPRRVERQAVADVDAGVQLVAFVQQNRLADSRREVEQVAEDAAAERAGDQQPVAGPAAGASERPAVCRLAERGDADHERTVDTCWCRRRRSPRRTPRPAARGLRKARWPVAASRCRPLPPRGRTSEITAASGRAAIAARSLRLAASACRPMRRGSSLPSTKIDAVGEAVGRDDDVTLPGERHERRIIGQARARARGCAGTCSRSQRMNSSSMPPL